MTRRKTMKATITKDAKKLWSCKNMKIGLSREYKGKLPKSSGEEITLFLPGKTPSPFCQAMRAWDVAETPKSMPNHAVGYMVCEHQVDLPKEPK